MNKLIRDLKRRLKQAKSQRDKTRLEKVISRQDGRILEIEFVLKSLLKENPSTSTE